MTDNAQQKLQQAIEFLLRQWHEATAMIDQQEKVRDSIEEQLSAWGVPIPGEKPLFHEIVTQVLKKKARLMLESDLISEALADLPPDQRPTRTPETQVAKSITQNSKIWKNKPTRFFRENGFVGLFEWKPILDEAIDLTKAAPVPLDQLEQALTPRFENQRGSIKTILESACEANILARSGHTITTGS